MILVFDFDGTLHDTAALYGRAVRSVLPELEKDGYAVPKECSDRDLSKYLGMTGQQMWEDFMPALPTELREMAREKVGQNLRTGITEGYARLYDGIPELLSDLKEQGHTLVILSNCREAYLMAHRAYFSLDQWFSGYYCSSGYENAPKEVIFESIRSDFPGEYIMIGDRASDIRVGIVHHIPTIACSYGFGREEEWHGADCVASCVQELAESISMVQGIYRLQ